MKRILIVEDESRGTPGIPLKSRDSRVTHFTMPFSVVQPRSYSE